MEKLHRLYDEKRKAFTAFEEFRKAQDGVMDTEAQAKFDKIVTDLDSITKQCENEERAQKIEKESTGFIFDGKGEKVETVEERQIKAKKITDKWMRKGSAGLTPEERTLIGVQKDAKGDKLELRATAGITNPTYGVDTELVKAVDAATLAYGGWFGACTEVTTQKGNTIFWPQFDDTAVTGSIEAVGTDAIDGGTAITLNRLQLDSYIYSSLGLVVGYDSLEDYDVPLSQMIYEPLATRLMRAQSTAFTSGTGSSQPDGIVTNAGIGEIITKDATPTRTDILNLIQDVDYSYHMGPKSGFMMHSNTMYKIQALSVGSSDDRPLWTPGMAAGAPSTIEGFKYWINNSMDQVGSNKHPLLFGDFSKHIIRKVGMPTLVRLDERYAEKLQVGFIMIQRVDSDTLQAGTAIKSARNLGT